MFTWAFPRQDPLVTSTMLAKSSTKQLPNETILRKPLPKRYLNIRLKTSQMAYKCKEVSFCGLNHLDTECKPMVKSLNRNEMWREASYAAVYLSYIVLGQ